MTGPLAAATVAGIRRVLFRAALATLIAIPHLALANAPASAASSLGPPDGYYATANNTSPETLRASLHEIIDDHVRVPYTHSSNLDTWDVLEVADQDPIDSSQILDVYRNASYEKFGGGNSLYNREHAWPKSFGFPDDLVSNYPYTDVHALFLSNDSYNSSRGNKPYAACTAACGERSTEENHGIGGGLGIYPGNSNWTTGSGPTGTWETWSGRRGDVARALLYLDVRYEGGQHASGNAEPDLVLTDDRSKIAVSGENTTGTAYMGLLSVLLQWHVEDPVDDRERVRNETVFGAQANRNPFIDHPEWVACVFGSSCDGVDTDPPSLPDALSADPGDGSVLLSWGPSLSPDLAGYTVHRSEIGGAAWMPLTSTLPDETEYVDQTVNNGTAYAYAVSATDLSGNESVWTTPVTVTPQPVGDDPWINEFHYDDKGKDSGEFVEIAGPAGTDLTGWSLIGYNGSNGGVYQSVNLNGALPDQQNGFGTVTVDLGSIQNGSPDGLALIDGEGRVVEFISYEGDLVAISGPAAGVSALDIGVFEGGRDPNGRSLQRTGTGRSGSEFNWQSPSSASPGQPNAGQTFSDGGGGGGGGDTTAPAAPTGLVAVAGESEVALDWADSGEADLAGYHVYRSTISAPDPVRQTVSLVSESGWVDAGSANGSTYLYAVTSVDAVGNESTLSGSIGPPAAWFSSSVADLVATFSDGSTDVDGSVVSWDWDFGDGSASTAQSPTHAYVMSGAYLVVLTVTDDAGASAIDAQLVTVGAPVEDLAVIAITPGTVAQNTTVDVTVSGTGFINGAGLALSGGSGPTPTVSNIVVVNDSTITARVRVKAGGPGKVRFWDVVVTNPDGSSDTLLNALVVNP